MAIYGLDLRDASCLSLPAVENESTIASENLKSFSTQSRHSEQLKETYVPNTDTSLPSAAPTVMGART